MWEKLTKKKAHTHTALQTNGEQLYEYVPVRWVKWKLYIKRALNPIERNPYYIKQLSYNK